MQARLLAEAERLGRAAAPAVHVFGFDGVRGMVAAGLGVAVLPEGAVVPYLGPNLAISALRLDEPWARPPSWLVAATSPRFRSPHGNSSSAWHRSCPAARPRRTDSPSSITVRVPTREDHCAERIPGEGHTASRDA